MGSLKIIENLQGYYRVSYTVYPISPIINTLYDYGTFVTTKK